MGKQSRRADRKIRLDVWRVRIALPTKILGILLVVGGVIALLPFSRGSPLYGLSQFHYIAGAAPLMPIAAWLIVAGLLMVVAGSLISRDWGIS